MIPRRRFLALAAVLALAASPFARGQPATEAAVKAALLYKFASFVEWPAERVRPEVPLAIGVTGDDDVASELEALARARRLDGRPILVRRLREGEPVSGLHLVFVGRAEAAHLPAWVRAARPVAAVVVSDAERGLEAGSVINFVNLHDRIGFDVSVEAAERSGVKISSRMLGVARRVQSKAS